MKLTFPTRCLPKLSGCSCFPRQSHQISHFEGILPEEISSIIKVFGHKIPDTDAVCGAIVRAWELEQSGEFASPFRLGVLNKETEFVLQTLSVDVPPVLKSLAPKSRVAIVDTNNPEELPDGLSECEITSVVDHHKLCGLNTEKPIEIDIRPLCSTGSILYARMKTARIKPTKKMAGLMLSCILSDSLEFRSPTTTEVDKIYACELAKLSGLTIKTHAAAMFAAKADIGHLSPKEVVMMDSKVFTIGGRRLRVSVVETTDPSVALQQQNALLDCIQVITQQESLDDLLFFVVNIIESEATYVSSSSTADELVRKAWNITVGDSGLAVIPNVVSRKAQIIPSLELAVKRT